MNKAELRQWALNEQIKREKGKNVQTLKQWHRENKIELTYPGRDEIELIS